MRYLRIGILLLLPLAAQAQTITLNSVTQLGHCLGDQTLISYTASGTFGTGNRFKVQLSDANGSFNTFTYVGESGLMSDTITIQIASGGRYRIKVISTSPFVSSSDNGNDLTVGGFPSPQVQSLRPFNLDVSKTRTWGVDRSVGIIEDTITFSDVSNEASGSTYLWDFGPDATPKTSTASKSAVVFSKEGLHTGTLTVTNSNGCSSVDTFIFRLLGCSPRIPSTASIVTDNAMSRDSIVWVKSGATFTAQSGDATENTYFVDAGGSLITTDNLIALVYIQSGASISLVGSGAFIEAVLTPGTRLTFGFGGGVDTFYCPSLAFDKLTVVDESVSSNLSLKERLGHLLAHIDDGTIDVKLFNVLGEEIVARRGTGEIDVDLSTIPAGVYFAIAQAGGERLTRRVAVVR